MIVSKNIPKGFSEIIKQIHLRASSIYFPDQEDLLCDQDVIQQKSYQIIDKVFEINNYKPESLVIFITKLDIEEIELGFIDLSNPSTHSKEYTSQQANYIYAQNQKLLRVFKTPFSSKLTSKEFGEEINKLISLSKTKSSDDAASFISGFIEHYETLLAEVDNYCKLVNLLFTSQALYVFTYQIALNENFARLMELMVLHGEPFSKKYPAIFDLAEKIYNVYISNMTAKVFNKGNFLILEKVFGSKVD